MLRYLVFIILMIGFIACGSDSNSKSNSKNDKSIDTITKKKPLSPHDTAMLMVGDTHIHIDYSSPGVRGRTIFGDLIPYGELWRAGAHAATSIEINKDIKIDGNVLHKGKYAMFIIPKEEEWTLIFNSRWDVHGTDKYSEKEDVFRIEVTPSILENIQEHLKYQVSKTDEQSGIISLAWEKTKVEIPFKIKNK